MHNDNGDPDENPGTGLVVRQTFKAGDILAKALGRAGRSEPEELDSSPSHSVPTEVRRVRRGRFFLSNYEQTTFGSVRYPIFQYWGHGVVVGEMRPRIREREDEPEGVWCYGAHEDFDLVPEFQNPLEWPEYTRTSTGWVRADGARRLGEKSSENVDRLIQKVSEIKRLL